PTTHIHTLSLHDALPIFTYKNMPQQKIDKLVPFITRDRVPTTGKMGGRGCAPGFMQGGVNNAATYQSGFGNTTTIKQTGTGNQRSEEHTSELQSRENLVC